MLSAQLGGTVAELKERMSYPEFMRWKVFYTFEPLGERRLDMMTALIVKTLLKLLANSDVAIDDLLPKFWDNVSTSDPSPAELAAKARLIFGALNAAKLDR